ncbi:MAG: hypothetical protein R3B47_15455 [Bacteroidia bacterium]
MQDPQFDISRLRDTAYKARFEALFAQARALREEGGYVELATRHPCWTSSMLCGKKTWPAMGRIMHKTGRPGRSFRQKLASHKHDISPAAYQELLGQLESIEALLLLEDYSENAKAGPALEKAQQELEAAISGKSV